MMNIVETPTAMDGLEAEALSILTSPDLTTIERRMAFGRLLTRYQVMTEYKGALAVFVRRMNTAQGHPIEPDDVLRDIHTYPEFACLLLVVLAVFVAVTYADGPRSAWVPIALLPMYTVTVPLP